MEIVVEIGTHETQEAIHQELTLLSSIVSLSNGVLNISKVIVPLDFDVAVNELQNTKDYRADKDRDVVALARNINLGDSFAIVLSPFLYTASHDWQTRLYIALHEIKHVYNNKLFPNISLVTGSKRIYTNNLYILFDEYVANRWALETLDGVIPEKSPVWNTFIKSFAKSFSLLICDNKYYENIKNEVEAFRQHSDIEYFQSKIRRSFYSVAMSIVHALSISDHNPSILHPITLEKSHFVNEKTLALMSFFKEKYQNEIFDIHTDLNLIIDFMTNFGMRFEDIPDGIYCHVLDI